MPAISLWEKNGITSLILRVFIKDTTSVLGSGKTGLSKDSAGLILSTLADNEASATTYAQASSNTETIATLGTFAAPSSGKARFKEVDSANFPGLYEIQIADARWAVSGARYVDVGIPYVAALANAQVLVRVQLTAFDPQTAVQAVDITKINGDATAAAQLARSAATIVNGAAVTGTLSTTQATTNLSQTQNDLFKGRILLFTSGVNQYTATDIGAYDGSTKKLTFTALPNAPANLDTFIIV